MSQDEQTTNQPYRVQKVSVVVAGADIQVREFVVAPGEEIPWHFHNQITDWCYCLEGVLAVEMRDFHARDKVSTQRLTPGQSCRIEPGVVHRLVNGGNTICRYLLIQGGGKYDFNKFDDTARR